MIRLQGMPNVFEVKNEEVLVQKHLNKIERARAKELQLFEEQQERLIDIFIPLYICKH